VTSIIDLAIDLGSLSPSKIDGDKKATSMFPRWATDDEKPEGSITSKSIRYISLFTSRHSLQTMAEAFPPMSLGLSGENMRSETFGY
jgi:hypothetical protein